MIPFDFEYYRPASVMEAVELFQHLHTQGKNPVYYSGGTEIITRARRNLIQPRAVVDLKSIPECGVMEFHKDQLVIGSCVTLSVLSAANPFPLLSEASQGVADQTARNKITIGGNISGIIHYREAVLPLLLADSHVLIAGQEGMKEVAIHEVFKEQLKLNSGEFLVQIKTDRLYVSLPYFHAKKRLIGNVAYPLVTLAAMRKDDQIRVAFSGVCAFPFRSAAIEQVLNDPMLSLKEKIDRAVEKLPAQVVSNAEGSAAYREFVLKLTLEEALDSLGGR
ncbi:xanthine dehydrogenase [Paenibacillus donghaensis]|uniref:FAD binding domain-containing protein n=1 Tax=Paenibacillus donghaensis TaxID=414771 RepID=UPI00188341E6|nr:FAD binding domain-containing protein [Paenibacillus donghaensis]MBE9914297.1 xanthine dehydrogenase [Paenibacillus donghaensis]